MPSAYSNGMPLLSDNAQIVEVFGGAASALPQEHQQYDHNHQHHQLLLVQQQHHPPPHDDHDHDQQQQNHHHQHRPFIVLQHQDLPPQYHQYQGHQDPRGPPHANIIYRHDQQHEMIIANGAPVMAAPIPSLLLVRGPPPTHSFNHSIEDTTSGTNSTAAGRGGGAAAAPAAAASQAFSYNASTTCASTTSSSNDHHPTASNKQPELYSRQHHHQRKQEIQRLRQQQRSLQKIHVRQQHQRSKTSSTQRQREQQHSHPRLRNVIVSPIKASTRHTYAGRRENITLSSNLKSSGTDYHQEQKQQHERLPEVVVLYSPQQQQEDEPYEGSENPPQKNRHHGQRMLEDDDEDSHLPQLPPLQLPPSALSKTSRPFRNDAAAVERPNNGTPSKKNNLSVTMLDAEPAATSHSVASATKSESVSNDVRKSLKRQHSSNSKQARKKSSNKSYGRYRHDLIAQNSILTTTNDGSLQKTITREETKEKNGMEEEHTTATSKSCTNRDSQEGANHGGSEDIDDPVAVQPLTRSIVHESIPDGKEFKPGDPIIPSNIFKIVVLVTSWLAEEIRLCHYGYCGNTSAESKRTTDESVSRAEYAAVAIEKFAVGVVFPNILVAYAENAEIGGDDVPILSSKVTGDLKAVEVKDNDKYALKLYDRIVVAVLLNLREILILNGTQLFGLEDREKYRVNTDEQTEDFTLKVKCLSTAIILNAAGRVTDEIDRQRIIDLVLDAIEKYDGGNEEFVSCMKRLDVRAIAVTPKGKVMKRYENIAYRVSYNVARLNHHLVSEQSTPYNIQLPSSNAVFVALAEKNMTYQHVEHKFNGPRKKEVMKSYKENMRKTIGSL